MRIIRAIGVLAGVALILALGPASSAGAQTSGAGSVVKELTLDGAVDPFIASYLKNGIEAANREGDAAVLIRIDTPGGLDSSMRTIVKAIQASKIPVRCWTGPSGARAASAGTFIMMACPDNGMAPGTEIGAAHPVGVQGSIERAKVTNDAAAFIKSLADANGYNADWAQSAVTDAKAVSAEDAFNMKPQPVTMHLAPSVQEYLSQVGYGNAAVVGQSPGLGVSLLHMLIDPNVTFIFFYLGIILIIVELLHPGVSVPGVLGTLLLVISIMSFGILPVQLGGVVLLVASAVLYLLELKHPGIGLPAIGGTICLVLGGLLLFDPSVPDLHVSRWLLAIVPTLVVAFFALFVQAALEARRQPPLINVDQLYGEEGVALTDLAPRGEIRVGHERWSAESVHGPISAGTVVRVVGRSGLKLTVVPDPTHFGAGPMEPSLPHPDAADQEGRREPRHWT